MGGWLIGCKRNFTVPLVCQHVAESLGTAYLSTPFPLALDVILALSLFLALGLLLALGLPLCLGHAVNWPRLVLAKTNTRGQHIVPWRFLCAAASQFGWTWTSTTSILHPILVTAMYLLREVKLTAAASIPDGGSYSRVCNASSPRGARLAHQR